MRRTLCSIVLGIAVVVISAAPAVNQREPGDKHFYDHDRHWSTEHDTIDAFYAVTDSKNIDPRKGETITKILGSASRDVTFAVLMVAPSNYREAHVSYDGTDELFNAWKAIHDLRQRFDRESLLMDGNVGIAQVRKDIEQFLGWIVGAPSVVVLVKRSAISVDLPADGSSSPTDVWPPQGFADLHFDPYLRPLKGSSEWFAAGLHRVGHRTYNEVKLLGALTFQPLVQRFCTEVELRDILRSGSVMGKVVVVAWHPLPEALTALATVALKRSRDDLMVAAVSDAATCMRLAWDEATAQDDSEVDDSGVDVDAAGAKSKSDEAVRHKLFVMNRDYNFENNTFVIYLFCNTMNQALGLKSYGLDYFGEGDPVHFLVNESRAAVYADGMSRVDRLYHWIMSCRRADYPSDVIPLVGLNRQKVVYTPASMSCQYGSHPRIGDKVLVESFAYDAKSLVEFHRWPQRWIVLGQGDHDLPLHYDLLLLNACKGLSVTAGLPAQGAPFTPVIMHTYSIVDIVRMPRAKEITDEERQQIGYTASEQLRVEGKALRALFQLQTTRFLDSFFGP